MNITNTNSQEQSYNIVIASDSNYTPHSATLIASIGETNSDINVVVHILDSGISDIDKENLSILLIQYPNIRIEYHIVTHESLIERLGGNVYILV